MRTIEQENIKEWQKLYEKVDKILLKDLDKLGNSFLDFTIPGQKYIILKSLGQTNNLQFDYCLYLPNHTHFLLDRNLGILKGLCSNYEQVFTNLENNIKVELSKILGEELFILVDDRELN